MITVIQGKPGMGKSVFLVSEIERKLKQGKKVYSTIDIKFNEKSTLKKNFSYIRPEEIMDTINTLREGEIVMDEIQAYLNSRKWDSLAIETQVFLQQHRKRGLNILGACQSIKRADVVFRELVQVFYGIKKIFSFTLYGYPMGLFWLNEYDADSIESGSRDYEKIGWGRPIFFDPVTFKLYDTTQEYHLPDKLHWLKHSIKKCQECGYEKLTHN